MKEPEAEINGTKMVYDKIHLPSLQIMTTNKEAMKATKKKAKTAKYLRLEDDKESQEGYEEEAKKVKEPEADNRKDLWKRILMMLSEKISAR